MQQDTEERVAHDVQRRIAQGETLDSILRKDAEQAQALGVTIDVGWLRAIIESWVDRYRIIIT